MNIFALYPSPQESARAHCDQHLHKMILESAQMASTAMQEMGFSSSWFYKPAYQNHPCTIWAGSSYDNLHYLLTLATELEVIRQELGHNYHSSSDVIKFCLDYLLEVRCLADHKYHWVPALAMPIQIKMRSDIDAYEKYRTYYRWKNKNWTALDKRPMTWNNRPVPSFMLSSQSPTDSTK